MFNTRASCSHPVKGVTIEHIAHLWKNMQKMSFTSIKGIFKEIECLSNLFASLRAFGECPQPQNAKYSMTGSWLLSCQSIAGN